MKTIPPAELEQLIALQARHQQLLAMLPAGVNDFADLAAAEFDAKLADIELVTAEMMVINAAERAILEELLESPEGFCYWSPPSFTGVD